MYAQLGQTIQAIKSRAVFQKRSIASTPMADFLKVVATSPIKGQANVEEAAVAFYLSNHGFHLIEGAHAPSAQLPPDRAALAERHARLTSEMSLRMFYYLLTISAEEARYGTARNGGFFDFVESSTSPDACKWLKKVMDGSLRGKGCLGSGAESGAATLGECVKSLEMCFRFAQWSPGFGGLPWAQITETAGEVVRGSNSLELMVDKAFTLCHNNGAIFNKGHYFSHYQPGFYGILDIQASGQMPAAVKAGVKTPGFGSAKALAIHRGYSECFPAEFGLAFDSSKVKSMETVRAKKAAAATAKAQAFISGGGGWGGAGQGAQSGPPKRACDDLFTMGDLEAIGVKAGSLGF